MRYHGRKREAHGRHEPNEGAAARLVEGPRSGESICLGWVGGLREN